VQNQTYNILLEFINGGTLADLFRSPQPKSGQEMVTFWRNLIQDIEPMMHIHQNSDPNGSRHFIEGYA
jgi:serine/threonine protein kinase